MSKKKNAKKLVVNKETVRKLSSQELENARGAAQFGPLTFGMGCNTSNCMTLGPYCVPTNNCMTLGEFCPTHDCKLTFGPNCR